MSIGKLAELKPIKIAPFVSHRTQFARVGRHRWSVIRLIKLAEELPVMELPLQHLNFYQSYEAMNLRDLVSHMKSVMEADLSYPIILDEDGEIMDGRHRIMKALLEEKLTILAVRFETNPEPCSIVED